MLIYQGKKSDFMYDMDNDSLSKKLEDYIYEKMHRKTPINEKRSWDNSMQYMYKVLNDDAIPSGANVAIEYNIPQTSKRVDFLISGLDDKDKGNVVIIELKQWEKIEKIEGLDALVKTYVAKGMRQVVHPSYQAWSYAALIRDYSETVQDNDILLHPCSYLHNYEKKENDPIEDKQYSTYIEKAPVFTKGDISILRDFIKKYVIKNDTKNLLYEIDNGKIKPSKSLQDSILKMVKGNKEFNLIDDQKVVYENILRIAKNSKNDNKKRTVIVEGGPGTGKTVVAINLLSDLTNANQFCQYVSKNQAPRKVFLAKLKGEKKLNSVDNMFRGSGEYTKCRSSIFDTLLVDEAHRLNEKSGLYKNLGENQIKEIINASKCSVFFIDESQRVTIDDIGSVKEIVKWAKFHNSEVVKFELTSQFRCNGSDGYLAWLDNLLEIRETANIDMSGIDYDFKVFDDPIKLKKEIFEKNKINNKSRILAGYCWEWIGEGKNDTTIHDINIGKFSMSWNLNNTSTYAIDSDSINQVGCIHTSQGLEFDYVGVIIGDDLRYENGRLVTDFTKRAKTDKSLFGIKKLYSINPKKALSISDEIIKNTYRTLMTRGMKGCYVYCTNKELSEYIKKMIDNK